MKRIFQRPYIYWFLGIFLLYLVLNIFISGFNDTIPLIIVYASTINWVKLGISLVLTLAIGFLVALNAVYIHILYKERKACKEGKVFAGAGTVGGLIVGVCPLCVTGFIPLVFGLFGVGFSFASLPFQGIEIQILVVMVLLAGFWILKNKNI
ncbi:MAG: hypothetical protein AABW93_00970 [Nanoarchaeota archaeon]